MSNNLRECLAWFLWFAAKSIRFLIYQRTTINQKLIVLSLSFFTLLIV